MKNLFTGSLLLAAITLSAIAIPVHAHKQQPATQSPASATDAAGEKLAAMLKLNAQQKQAFFKERAGYLKELNMFNNVPDKKSVQYGYMVMNVNKKHLQRLTPVLSPAQMKVYINNYRTIHKMLFAGNGVNII